MSFSTDSACAVVLETDLTPELILEGHAREIVRTIQSMRRDLDLDYQDRAMWSGQEPGNQDLFNRVRFRERAKDVPGCRV